MDEDIEPASLAQQTADDQRRSADAGERVAYNTDTTTDTRAQSIEKTLVSRGQRRVNLIWEVTQAVLAVSVVGTALFVSALLAVDDPQGTGPGGIMLFGLANLVTGFYFGRTNHQRTGGVGPTDVGR
jgi:hypothetical protein